MIKSEDESHELRDHAIRIWIFATVHFMVFADANPVSSDFGCKIYSVPWIEGYHEFFDTYIGSLKDKEMKIEAYCTLHGLKFSTFREGITAKKLLKFIDDISLKARESRSTEERNKNTPPLFDYGVYSDNVIHEFLIPIVEVLVETHRFSAEYRGEMKCLEKVKDYDDLADYNNQIEDYLYLLLSLKKFYDKYPISDFIDLPQHDQRNFVQTVWGKLHHMIFAYAKSKTGDFEGNQKKAASLFSMFCELLSFWGRSNPLVIHDIWINFTCESLKSLPYSTTRVEADARGLGKMLYQIELLKHLNNMINLSGDSSAYYFNSAGYDEENILCCFLRFCVYFPRNSTLIPYFERILEVLLKYPCPKATYEKYFINCDNYINGWHPLVLILDFIGDLSHADVTKKTTEFIYNLWRGKDSLFKWMMQANFNNSLLDHCGLGSGAQDKSIVINWRRKMLVEFIESKINHSEFSTFNKILANGKKVCESLIQKRLKRDAVLTTAEKKLFDNISKDIVIIITAEEIIRLSDGKKEDDIDVRHPYKKRKVEVPAIVSPSVYTLFDGPYLSLIGQFFKPEWQYRESQVSICLQHQIKVLEKSASYGMSVQ